MRYTVSKRTRTGGIQLLTAERWEEILQFVDREGAGSVQELAFQLHASESTIRRDLLELHKKGYLKRVRGGATSIKAKATAYDARIDNIQSKYKIRREEKRNIAQYAASVIEPEDFIYIDAGSTTEQMADFIDAPGIQIVTNNIPLALKLAYKGISVSLVPGHVKASTESMIGSVMCNALNQYRFKKGFFGTNGLTLEDGCSSPDPEEVVCKRTALLRCKEVYILADSDKIGVPSNASFAALEEVNIITNRQDDIDFRLYEERTEVHYV